MFSGKYCSDKKKKQGTHLLFDILYIGASLVAQLVKHLPAIWETCLIPGWEDPLEKGKKLPTPVFWHGEFHELYSPQGHKEWDMTERLSFHFQTLLENYT